MNARSAVTLRRPARQSPQRAKSRGFTIVEIIVVVVIIGVLATLILPRLIGRVGEAKQGTAKSNLAQLEAAVEMFSHDYGRLPQEMAELVNRPSDVSEDRWHVPTVKAKDLLDPWGRPWILVIPSSHGNLYDLYSLGADGTEGGTGENADVVNW